MDALAYCEERLTHPDSDYPLLRVFLGRESRGLHAALQALRRELLGIPDEVKDPDVARFKLQWWREELLRLAHGEPRHPVTELLRRWRDGIDPGSLLRMTVAVDEILQNDNRWTSFDALFANCRLISGMPAAVEAQALGCGEDACTAAQQLGVAAHLARLLDDPVADARHGRLVVPMDELARFQVRREAVRDDPEAGPVRALLAFQAHRAGALYSEALGALSPVQRHALLAWTIRAQLDLARLRGGPGRKPGPARRLWIAWRTASRTRRQFLSA